MTITGFIKPRSPDLISIQKQLKGLFTGALLRAAQHHANPATALPTANNEVELAMHGLVKATALTHQGRVNKLKARATDFFNDPANSGLTPILGGFDPKGASVLDQITKRNIVAAVKLAPELAAVKQSGKLSDLSTWLTNAKVASGTTLGTAVAAPAPVVPKIKSVKLQFDRIKCEDTDEFFGEDRIITGGMGFDTTVQGIRKVGKFRLNSNRPQGTFAQGSAKDFSPDVKFIEFPLGSGGFPRFIQANVLLFEEDQGGAADLLQALWDSVGAQLTSLTVSITAAITGAAITGAITGTSIGAAVGSAIPGLGTAVGAIAGAVAGIVLGALIAALMSWLKDDLLGDPDEPVAPFLILESATERFSNNSLKSPVEILEFRNPDSNYRINAYWELVV